jgi:cation diffusion facilitator family transporter
VQKLLHPRPLESPGWGVAVMLVSVVANIVVSQMLFRVGNRTHSIALQADAWHLRTDVYTSAGVMVALGVISLGHRYLPRVDLQWVDPLAAIGVAMLILRAAYDLTARSVHDLVDVSLPAAEVDLISRAIEEMRPAICDFHKIRTRKSGSMRFIELHLLVPPGMSVKESHSVSDSVVARIKSLFPDSHVLLHVEPCDGQCTFGSCRTQTAGRGAGPVGD